MLRHLVMFRRRADVAPDADLERRLAARLEGLNQHVPGTRYWLFRANELSRPVSWDYILDSSFDDLQAMQDYLLHPIHQTLILDLKPYFEWAVVDYTEDSVAIDEADAAVDVGGDVGADPLPGAAS